MNLLDRVLENEGFESKPYRDHLGVLTIGHGITFLTFEESKAITEGRLKENLASLIAIYPWLVEHPQDVAGVVTEMSYQMGIKGVSAFVRMWAAIERGDYEDAAREGLDSLWATQTPERAERLMDILRNA